MTARRSFALASLRYRRWGTLGLLLLSAVAVAAAAFAPLFSRAVGQAGLHSSLAGADVSTRGLAVAEPDSAANPAAALRDVDRSRYGRAQVATEIQIGYRPGGLDVQGPIVHRTGQCTHLHIVTGRCATADTDVVASSSAARRLHLRVGMRLTVTGSYQDTPSLAEDVTVVGLYAPFAADTDYWFDHAYSSAAGAAAVADPSGNSDLLQADALFTGDGFFGAFGSAVDDPTFAVDTVPATRTVELPLLVDRVRLDDIAALRRGVAATQVAAVRAGGRTSTGITGLLHDADTGRTQAGRIIPALAVELALIVVVALAVVVQSATEDRRAQIALARLRGLTGRSATRSVFAELAPVGAAGLVLGAVAAWGAARLADGLWLDGHGQPELRWPPIAAAVAVVLAQAVFTLAVVRRATTRPVHDLLRGVPAPARRGATLLEVSVAAVALAGVVVTVSGDRHTLLALATPAVLALAAGLVLSRFATAVARRVGTRLFWRGAGAVTFALLQFARRPGMRRVVTVVCVASAIAVSACVEAVVATDNRDARAAVAAGATRVLTTDATSITGLERAVDRADPSGTSAAAVVTQAPPNGPAVLAVDPRRFRAVAQWGYGADTPSATQLARLDPALPPTVRVTGSRLSLTLTDVQAYRSPNPTGIGVAGPAYLQVELTPVGGEADIVRFGPLPDADTARVTLPSAVPCAAGCRVTGLSLRRTPSDLEQLRLSADLSAAVVTNGGSTPVALGTASSWASVSGRTTTAFPTPDTIGLTQHGSGLRLGFVNAGSAAELQQLSTPVAVPALATTDVSTAADSTGQFRATGVDGLATPFAVTGRLHFLPGPRHPQLVVDLDYAARVSGGTTVDGGTAAVWLSNDGARSRVTTALLAEGIHVTASDSTAAHRAVLDAAAPATAMRLAFVAAGLAIVLAGLVQLLTVLASARARRTDQLALRSIGAGGRALARGTALEQVIAVVLGVVTGTAVGLLGVTLTFDAVPIFVRAAGVPDIRRSIPADVVAATAGSVVVALGVVAAATAALTSARRRTWRRAPGRDAGTEA